MISEVRVGRRSWGPAAVVPIVAVLGLLVAGCSDPEPRFAEPTESASPSASGPAEPDSDSPESVVLGWVEARNESLSSGDTSAAQALALPGCKACTEYIDEIEEIVRRGGFIDSNGWTVDQLATRGKQTPEEVSLQGRLVRSAGETDLGDGSDPITYPRTEDDAVFKLVKRGDSWLLSEIFLLA